MEKQKIENLLLQGKYKKYSKTQLLSMLNIEKEEDKQVIIGLLKQKGVSEEEINTNIQTKKEEIMKNSVVEKQEIEVNKTQRKDIWYIDPVLIKTEEGFNTRFDYGDLEELKNSIIENGVKIPMRGYKEGENYILVDGHRRLAAINLALQEGIDIARVPFLSEKKKSLEERIFEIILSNDGKALTPLELGETYKRLTQFGFNFTEIAKKIGKTIKHVSDMVGVAESSKEVKEIIKDGGISASLVAEMRSKIKNDEETEEIIKTVTTIKKESSNGDKKKEKVTKKDIEDLLPSKEPDIVVDKEDLTFTEEEVRELLKRQIKACANELPLALRLKVLQTKLVIE